MLRNPVLTTQRGQLAVTLLCSSLVLSGCSGSDSNQQANVVDAGLSSSELSEKSEFVGDVPQFEGPWAVEFSSEYESARSDFVRSVLADETITDQELSETRDKFTECLSAYGFNNISFEADGAFHFDAPDKATDNVNEQVLECSEVSGEASVGALHSWIRRNPDNQDESVIMAECLVRKGAVDPSYSAEEFSSDAPTLDFPYLDGIDGEIAFHECNADPLGLYEHE